ncbi:DUF948 domain-containing protein [Lentibacillus amyloliquefaciens]|uniref:General stress protein n=1 Tax=Lentibacillus amyloliquefaciens TaxID=1472767 RepID=A0A0U3NRS9_9BACI|nr:DUF948 domain-containing protein [Lentibacillus amyloliquefaciens]ALX49355.1 hypothetical protein AOX59_12650 [Lentibacillus amyloliquefaciens]
MDWAGIGVIVIGIALLAVAGLLVKPLTKLTEVLTGVKETTNALPNQIADVMDQTKTALNSANGTLKQVNEQVDKLKPLTQLAYSIGMALQNLFKTLTKINDDMRAKTDNPTMRRYNLESIYGVMALGYTVYERQKANKSE